MPDPAYTIDECISRLDTICGIYGAYNWEASLLHHLRAAQSNADRLAALETLYTAAKAEHEALDAAPALLASARDLAALLDALPRCRWKSPELTEHGQRVLCDRLATVGTLSHEPEWCDEHAASHVRDCDWAGIVRRRDGR